MLGETTGSQPWQITPELKNLLFDKQITRIDSPYPAGLLRDLNGSCAFSSTVHNASQAHYTPRRLDTDRKRAHHRISEQAGLDLGRNSRVVKDLAGAAFLRCRGTTHQQPNDQQRP